MGKKLKIKFNPEKTQNISINDRIDLKTIKYMREKNVAITMDGKEILKTGMLQAFATHITGICNC